MYKLANSLTKTVRCEECGVEVTSKSPNRKYCDDCGKERSADSNRKNQARMWREQTSWKHKQVVAVDSAGIDGLFMAMVKQALLDHANGMEDATQWLLDRGQDFVLATGGEEDVHKMMEAIDNGAM